MNWNKEWPASPSFIKKYVQSTKKVTALLSSMFVNSLKILILILAGQQTLWAQGHNLWH